MLQEGLSVVGCQLSVGEGVFPFTKQDEILYWATLYTKDQKPKRKRQEKDIIKIKCSVRIKAISQKPN